MWATPRAQERQQHNSNDAYLALSLQAQMIQVGATSPEIIRGSRPQLNAAFVCWMMGLPFSWTHPEWTNSDVEETALWFYAQRRRLAFLLGE